MRWTATRGAKQYDDCCGEDFVVSYKFVTGSRKRPLRRSNPLVTAIVKSKSKLWPGPWRLSFPPIAEDAMG
ncbi:hypothetical protein HDF16_004901 [Granulicella aggregans]|uniref:Uncharacterized protein n=1 Tax=Granulicella aggregans TaxID=474949 RepID=A0A7W7ZHS7_9BACT|nr:hypothetical protein [Granulicella aggregans]